MKLENLIGKKISDIKSEITDFDYDGSIPLETSNSVIILDSGELIRIPDAFDEKIEVTEITSENQTSLFNTLSENRIRNKITSWFSESESAKIMNRNSQNIQNKKITAIYIQKEGSHPELEKCVLELDSGFLISEIEISVTGTGRTGIWIFTSKEDLYSKFGNNFLRLCPIG